MNVWLGNELLAQQLTKLQKKNGVVLMVTYEALFSFCLVVIGIIALFQGKKK